MEMVPVNLLKIDATFHTENICSPDPAAKLFTFSGDITDGVIEVPQGIGMIIFNLITSPETVEPALFQTAPVQWFKTASDGSNLNEPVLLPDMFMLHRLGDKTVTLIDFNSNQSDALAEKKHWYNLVVVWKTKTYGADPSIVNLPPDGGV